jgi:hypothetical protein
LAGEVQDRTRVGERMKRLPIPVVAAAPDTNNGAAV